MQNNLQAILTRVTVSFLLVIGAATAVAQELQKEADMLYERRAFFEASSEYVAAYAKEKNLDSRAHCAFYAGECYRFLHNHDLALEWYDKALGLRYASINPAIFLLYGDVLRDQENFFDAMEWYEKYGSVADRSVADARIEASDIAALSIDEPPSRYIVEPMYTINSPEYDFAPIYYSKKNNT